MDKAAIYKEYLELLTKKELERQAIAVIYDKDLNKNYVHDIKEVESLIKELFNKGAHDIEITKPLPQITKIKLYNLYRDRNIQKCKEISINKKDKIIYAKIELKEYIIHFKDKKSFTNIKNNIKKELSKLIFS